MSQNKLKIEYILSILITALAIFASASGILVPSLYRDNLWAKSLWYGNDLITLFVAVPILITALIHTARGSMRAQLVWLGMVYYMFFNYFYYLFGSVFNRFFLVYAAIFLLSIFTIILGLMKFDFEGIYSKFRDKTPVKRVSFYMLLFAGSLGSVWIMSSLLFSFTGKLPQLALDSEPAARLIFGTDLTLMVPFFILGAILLWKRRSWGYVLGTALNVGIANYGLQLSAGTIAQYIAGVPGALMMLPAWCFVTVGCTIAALFMLKNIISIKILKSS